MPAAKFEFFVLLSYLVFIPGNNPLGHRLLALLIMSFADLIFSFEYIFLRSMWVPLNSISLKCELDYTKRYIKKVSYANGKDQQ